MLRLFLLLTAPALCIVAPLVLRAEVLVGAASLDATWPLSLDVEIDTAKDQVTITLTGPDDRWFAVGFDATAMLGDPYTLVADGTGVAERALGFHAGGNVLPSSLTSVSDTSDAGIRTVVVTRAIEGQDAAYYSFPTAETAIDLIYAQGDATLSFGYHGPTNKDTVGFAVMALAPVPSGGPPASFLLVVALMLVALWGISLRSSGRSGPGPRPSRP